MNSNFLNALISRAGFTSDEYQSIQEDIVAENYGSLKIYSVFMVLFFSGLTAASMTTVTFATINRFVYAICTLISVVIMVCVWFLMRKNRKMTMPLSYLCMTVLYTFSLIITALHPEVPAVTTMVLLVVIPLLFTDRPMHLACVTVIVTAVFCVMVDCLKPKDIAIVDIWNSISFGLLAIVVDFFIVRLKIRSLLQANRITELSKRDLLTGLLNRNSYEQRLNCLASPSEASTGVIYADANGLHELNNTCGHEAGDRMLKEVASVLMEVFGADDTYRIGGDEFLCFFPADPAADMEETICRLKKRIEEKGYSVSMGYALKENEEADMPALVRAAEEKMYQDKTAYYVQNERGR